MNIFNSRIWISFGRNGRFYSTKAIPKNEKSVYKDTLCMPKTKFESFLKDAVARDKLIEKEAKFLSYYEWQRKNVNGNEFVLHDGPPYANGDPHMGHAINKILKDIILRSKIIQGSKVHFVPGWDCHGLPIELIAIKDMDRKLSPVEVRKICKELAFNKVDIQKKAFKGWGVMGDWDKNCYYTCTPEYVINQLDIFMKLYEKGLIYYGLKPVYWSPSSGTALAESELIYKDDHVSQAVTVQFEAICDSGSEPINLLIWTTTPWTLPLNKAVYFTSQLQYSLVKISSLHGSYIIATDLIEENKNKLNKEITILRSVSHDELKKMKYKHPWNQSEIMNVFESPHVKAVATGLLHCVPSHGHDDFLLGIRDGLLLECFVDEVGRYTKDVGLELEGLSVVDDGSNCVIEKLESSILHKESYVHKYPYDWRTGKPVIIRSSHQWFIDTESLKSIAEKCLSDVSVPMKYFTTQLQQRPYWCISRQRVWGVPIPAFINKKTGKPIVSKELTEHLCKLFKEAGADSWWSEDIRVLFPERFCKEFNVEIQDVKRGGDILDIWFDSGISWSFALDGKIADICVEGNDQLEGWFQSSLLTSAGVREQAPYKKLLVHGFAVDEHGKKMSKSLGNVFDPRSVTEGDKALGVDTLRWWVGSHGHQPTVAISTRLLKEDNREVNQIRLIFKFLLGCLRDSHSSYDESISPSCFLDIYYLNSCYEFYHSIVDKYNNYDFQGVVSKYLNFVSSISSLYIGSIKDRLYCDDMNSDRRKSCVNTLAGMFDTLSHCIAPILPHLVEEVYMHHPSYSEKPFFYSTEMWTPPQSWKNELATKHIQLAKDMRKKVINISPKTQQYLCLIEAEETDYNLLMELQGGKEESSDSELTELLQVAFVQLKMGSPSVSLLESEHLQCRRCRRFTAVKSELCARCVDVISKLVSQK